MKGLDSKLADGGKGETMNAIRSSTEDVRFAPTYEIAEAARYLHLRENTLRSWLAGQTGRKAVVATADSSRYLSFMGLVEAHIISGMRVRHKIPLQRIRKAIDYLKKEYKTSHPLIGRDFKTNGKDLFLDELSQDVLINVSRYGQTGMREVLDLYLTRIVYDEMGLPESLYPFTQLRIEQDPKIIVINPKIGFGRPVIRAGGIRTSSIAERFKAGESIASLVEDFGRSAVEVEAAIRSELDLEIAA
jgi:uncharacterized protein (DUF433 family)